MTSFELFEVELRAVARLGERAWAFNPESGWREAPGLVGKASGAGQRLTPEEFAREFPAADLSLIALCPAPAATSQPSPIPAFNLYELELRAVVVLDERAWVFNDGFGWREAPALVRKAQAWGITLTPDAFAREFPEADLSKIPLNDASANPAD